MTARRLRILLGLCLGAGVALHLWRAWPMRLTLVDDAWISARYASEAWNHGVLSYNAEGPAVEGYTNLLWTLGLALAHGLPIALSTYMWSFGLLFSSVAVLAGGLLTERLARPPAASEPVPWSVAAAALCALALGADIHLAVIGTNGLETSQFVAAVLLGAWATLAGRKPLQLALIVLLPAIRPEGAAVSLALAGYSALSPSQPTSWKDSVRWRPLAAALLSLLALGALRAWIYGALVPNTWDAKTAQTLSGLWQANQSYLAPDGYFWPAVLALGSLGLLGRITDRRAWLLACLALGLALIALRVPMWMPGMRLLVTSLSLAITLGAALLGQAWPARLLGLLLVPALSLYAFTSDAERHNRRYDEIHSALPGNPASAAAAFLGAHAPPNSSLAVRDAGVFAYFIGPDVHVIELHQRALTLPHPNGDDAAVLAACPKDPTFVVLTTNERDKNSIRYGNDRGVFQRLSEPYDYLGRVEQHHRRYYDVYARQDAGIPALPAELVLNFKGPLRDGIAVKRAP